jgi:addiction module HigA family antidote
MKSKPNASEHPGVVLRKEVLEPLELSQYRLAKDIGVPPRRINEILQGKRGVTPDTALRLSRYLGMDESFWLYLQMLYDLEVEKRRLGYRLEREVKVRMPVGKTGTGR